MNAFGVEVSPVQIAVACAVGFPMLYIAARLLSRPKVDRHTERVKCVCGWSGVVSRYHGECPMCRAKLGSQVANS